MIGDIITRLLNDNITDVVASGSSCPSGADAQLPAMVTITDMETNPTKTGPAQMTSLSLCDCVQQSAKQALMWLSTPWLGQLHGTMGTTECRASTLRPQHESLCWR